MKWFIFTLPVARPQLHLISGSKMVSPITSFCAAFKDPNKPGGINQIAGLVANGAAQIYTCRSNAPFHGGAPRCSAATSLAAAQEPRG